MFRSLLPLVLYLESLDVWLCSLLTLPLQYLSLVPWTLLLAQPRAPHRVLPALSPPALSWSTPRSFSPVCLLNPFLPFPGLPVLSAPSEFLVRNPTPKTMKSFPALEQWLSSFVKEGDLFLKREDSFLSMKFSEAVIWSRMRFLVFREYFHTVIFWFFNGKKPFGFFFFFNTGTDLGNWKEKWENCGSESL